MKKLRVFLVCLALQMGVFAGVPMRPDEIEELMRQMNRPTCTHVLPTVSDDGCVD